ncbi:hypothetical protein OPV22_025769 [Ensete ventricosum]|uniref:Uncharacterized protein n=1 Tax=Ensete ventricosum TaxID=4639 RepID=A0AAV8Q8B4_ENSVE|nr:hypothetical protein OPV22_025769 [Ensete ventricosum]
MAGDGTCPSSRVNTITPSSCRSLQQDATPVLVIQILLHFNYAGLHTRYQSRMEQQKLLLGSEEGTTMVKLEMIEFVAEQALGSATRKPTYSPIRCAKPSF